MILQNVRQIRSIKIRKFTFKGEFRDGYPTGTGTMTLPDLSYYKGDFCKGIFHGEGVFCITSSPMMYSGQWKGGKKHGEQK